MIVDGDHHAGVRGFARSSTTSGVRNHVFVLPVVVCSTLLSREIAAATGAVSMTHQHGCGHIGDDVEHTERTYAGLAQNPNVAATLVMSLGCETLQGPRVARRIAAAGHRVELVGIQSSGGADAAREQGTAVCRSLVDEVAAEGTPVDLSTLVIGVHLGRRSALVEELAARLRGLGARLLLAGSDPAVSALRDRLEPGQSRDEVEFGATTDRAVAAVEPNESGARSQLALAVSGAVLVIAAPDTGQAPSGLPVVPVVAVGSADGLHRAIRDDFDLDETVDVDDAMRFVLEVCAGRTTASEQRGAEDVMIPRLRRTM